MSSFKVQVLQDLYCRKLVQLENGAKRWLYNYPMIANTTDLVVFDQEKKHALLVKRGPTTEPVEFRGLWAIPGGFMNPDETTRECAAREYYEETGEKVNKDDLQFVTVADKPDRDPRQRTVSFVYTATTKRDSKSRVYKPIDKEEISEVSWVNVENLLNGKVPMAFDHVDLLRQALRL